MINKKFEVLFFPKIHRTIKAKFKETIAVIKSDGVQAAITSLNKDLTNPELRKAIEQLYSVVGLRYANDTTRSLKQQERGAKKDIIIQYEQKGFGFNQTWVDWIIGYLKEFLVTKITFSVNQTTKDYLLQVLNRSITEGMGVDETVRLLEGSDFSETQAARIVRTEVNRASNAGTLAAGQTYEFQMQKKWISVHDNRTRGVNPKDHASHIGLDKTTIDFEDSFIDPRNGDRLQSPGDPKASAESTINCRCQMSLKPKRDHNGRLIPKRQSTVVIYPNQRRQRIITI